MTLPNRTSFQPGHSGNPKGRPSGSRSMARRLRQALSYADETTPYVSVNELIATQVISALLHLRINTPDGSYDVTVDQWLDLVKWVHRHVDGPRLQQGADAFTPEEMSDLRQHEALLESQPSRVLPYR